MEDNGVKAWGLADDGKEVALALGGGPVGSGKGEKTLSFLALGKVLRRLAGNRMLERDQVVSSVSIL